MGSAGTLSSAPRGVLGLGYAYTEGVLEQADTHQRLGAELALGYAPFRSLQLSLALDARYDKHSGNAGSDSGGAFGTQLSTRHAFAITDALSLAARTKLRFPAAASVGRGFRAVTPELGAIATYMFRESYELSFDVGYRIDRSEQSVADTTALSRADLLAASISRYDAALLGALFALPLGPVTASAEWSWDVAVGSGAPSATESPMRLRLAAQTRWHERYVPGVELGISPSSRPALDKLARIEPRFWFGVHVGFVFEGARASQTDATGSTPAVSEVALEPAVLDLRVVDPAGVAVADASVTLQLDGQDQSVRTSAEGTVQLTLATERAQQLTVESAGFETQRAEVQGEHGRHALTITLARTLPEGEIKGSVRSLRGSRPVRARITVAPIGITVDTDDKGDFVIGVPPGQYTLEITAAGHEPQQRSAQVERLGVTILVVDLRRAPK